MTNLQVTEGTDLFYRMITMIITMQQGGISK
jgi:hypothetical protein